MDTLSPLIGFAFGGVSNSLNIGRGIWGVPPCKLICFGLSGSDCDHSWRITSHYSISAVGLTFDIDVHSFLT
jgi:hypothetical protein